MNNFEWFKNAKYGMMIHWGLYSIFGGQFEGKNSSSYAEWIQSYFRIPNKKMEKLAKKWNPNDFDAKKIVHFAKTNGMKYIIITAKHHDGFAMYKSNIDKYNIFDFTLLKRDIIKELSNECKIEGIKFGLYYSQDIDWHEQNGGGYLAKVENCAGTSWDNNWDFPNQKEKDFNKYFVKKVIPQIKELLTNYGEISLLWFDMPLTLSTEQSKEIYNICKKYQPNCLINSRLGNGSYDYVSLGDNEIPASIPNRIENANSNSINGFKLSPNKLYEVACTINNSWGYSKIDKDYKTLEKINYTKKKVNSLGINYLLNIPLDEFGNIPNDIVKIFKNDD